MGLLRNCHSSGKATRLPGRLGGPAITWTASRRDRVPTFVEGCFVGELEPDVNEDLRGNFRVCRAPDRVAP